MTFVIETENLESAYCFGLDMLEYLIEKSKQPYSYSYYLFVKNLEKDILLEDFDYRIGEISLNFLHDHFPYDAQQVLLSGGEEFRSRMYRYLRELPNSDSDLNIREYT